MRGLPFNCFRLQQRNERVGPLGQRENQLPTRSIVEEGPQRACQPFNQRIAQEDWKSPQLSHGERAVLLELSQDWLHIGQVDQQPLTGQKCPRNGVNARQPAQRAIRQARQSRVKGARQVFADLAQCLPDDVIIIQQPLGGVAQRKLFAGGLAESAIGLRQPVIVNAQVIQQRVARPTGDRAVALHQQFHQRLGLIYL